MIKLLYLLMLAAKSKAEWFQLSESVEAGLSYTNRDLSCADLDLI
jgi:hypothetical protein